MSHTAQARFTEVLDDLLSVFRGHLETALEVEFLTPLAALRAENAQLREQVYAAAALPVGAASSSLPSASQSALNPIAGPAAGSEVVSAEANPDERAAVSASASAADSVAACAESQTVELSIPLDQSMCRPEVGEMADHTPSTNQEDEKEGEEEEEGDIALHRSISEIDQVSSQDLSSFQTQKKAILAKHFEKQCTKDSGASSPLASPINSRIGLLNVPDAFRGRGGLMSPKMSMVDRKDSVSSHSTHTFTSEFGIKRSLQSQQIPSHKEDLSSPEHSVSAPPAVRKSLLPPGQRKEEDDEDSDDDVAGHAIRAMDSVCANKSKPKQKKKWLSILSTDGKLIHSARSSTGSGRCERSHMGKHFSASSHFSHRSSTGGKAHDLFVLHGTWSEIARTGHFNSAIAGDWDHRGRHNLSSAAASKSTLYASTDNDSDAPSELEVFSKKGACSSCQQRHMVQPNSLRRLFWDLLGMTLVFWDMIWIPFLLFDPGDMLGTEICGWVARIFWTLDIPASFLTGYITHEGVLEMSGKKVSKRYMKSRLPFDLALVWADWIEVMVGTMASFLNTARVGKVLRTFRVLRMIRLARLLKLPGIMDMLTERIFSERVVLLMSIVKSTSAILVVAHVIACFWYKLATMHSNNWLTENGYEDTDLGLKYVVSLHWSMTRFIGDEPVQSTNLAEHIYAIVSLILSFVMSAAFVSSITTAMTRLQIIGVEDQQNFSMLRRYLRLQAVSTKLAMRVTRNAQFALKQQKDRLVENDVVLFQVLSEPLMIELHYEVYARVLRAHPAFDLYCMCTPQAMRKVCHTSVSVLHVSKGDILFNKGERPDHGQMLMVMNGALKYDQENGLEKQQVEQGGWVCEMVLWASWIHCGNLRVETECSLLALSSEKLQFIGQRYFDTDEDIHPAAYARWYVGKMSKLQPNEMTDLDPGFGLSNEMRMALAALTSGVQGGWNHANEKKGPLKVSFGEASSEKAVVVVPDEGRGSTSVNSRQSWTF